MTTAVAAPARAIRACLLNLGGELFAVDVASARELVVLEEFTTVPLGPDHLVGVTNLRGYVLPVLDVRPLLRLPVTPVARGTRLLVIGSGTAQVGIATDGVVGLESFDGDPVPLGEAACRQYGELGAGLLRRGDRLVALLSVPKVLEALRIGEKGA